MTSHELNMPIRGQFGAPRRTRSARWRYVPLGLLVLAGLMLTGLVFGLAERSQWGVVAAGISLTSLAAVYFAILVGREREIEQTVVIRTDELQREIADRKQAEAMLTEKNDELLAVQSQLREMNQHLEERVRERTSAIEKLLKQKEDLIVQLGHDLRSPLTPLVGLVPLLREQQTDPRAVEMTDVIARNVEHIHKLVEKTLRLANAGRNRDEPFDVTQVQLSKLLAEFIRRRAGIFSEHNIRVENLVDPTITVAADGARLNEVLDDLANNAVRFTADDGTITFDARKTGDMVVVSVRDTGIGLTQAQLASVFDEFYKADEARHDLDSPGLGLSICRRIITRHGGEIWAESEGIGMGTTFYFSLPLRIVDGSTSGKDHILTGRPDGP